MGTNRFSRDAASSPARVAVPPEEQIHGSNAVLYAPRNPDGRATYRMWRMGDADPQEYDSVIDAWAALDQLDLA